MDWSQSSTDHPRRCRSPRRIPAEATHSLNVLYEQLPAHFEIRARRRLKTKPGGIVVDEVAHLRAVRVDRRGLALQYRGDVQSPGGALADTWAAALLPCPDRVLEQAHGAAVSGERLTNERECRAVI